MASPNSVSGTAATMTILATGLGSSITSADPVILSANISAVRDGLALSAGTASLVASMATLALAAGVLGAGALGDRYGMRRMYSLGLLGTMVFGVAATLAPNAAVLLVAVRSSPGPALSCAALSLSCPLCVPTGVFQTSSPESRSIA